MTTNLGLLLSCDNNRTLAMRHCVREIKSRSGKKKRERERKSGLIYREVIWLIIQIGRLLRMKRVLKIISEVNWSPASANHDYREKLGILSHFLHMVSCGLCRLSALSRLMCKVWWVAVPGSWLLALVSLVFHLNLCPLEICNLVTNVQESEKQKTKNKKPQTMYAINCQVTDMGKHFSNGVLEYPSVSQAVHRGMAGWPYSHFYLPESLRFDLLSILASAGFLSSINFMGFKSTESFDRQ